MLNDRVTLATVGGTVIDKAIAVQLAKNGSKVALPSPRPCSPSIRGPKEVLSIINPAGPSLKYLPVRTAARPFTTRLCYGLRKRDSLLPSC